MMTAHLGDIADNLTADDSTISEDNIYWKHNVIPWRREITFRILKPGKDPAIDTV